MCMQSQKCVFSYDGVQKFGVVRRPQKQNNTTRQFECNSQSKHSQQSARNVPTQVKCNRLLFKGGAEGVQLQSTKYFSLANLKLIRFACEFVSRKMAFRRRGGLRDGVFFDNYRGKRGCAVISDRGM